MNGFSLDLHRAFHAFVYAAPRFTIEAISASFPVCMPGSWTGRSSALNSAIRRFQGNLMMTPEQRYFFDVFGYLHLKGAIEPDDLKAAQEAAERYVRTPPDQIPPGFGIQEPSE